MAVYLPQYVHFQLTGRCNLQCRFCGQARGMLATQREELPVAHWLLLARELVSLHQASGTRPEITLWGGEPLLYAGFAELVHELAALPVALHIVTNGTLIDRHAGLLNECFDTIHVSVDGPEKLHDAVRGAGTYRKLCRNLEHLRDRRGELVFLTTVSDANVGIMRELPALLAPLRPDRVVLQQLMYLSAAEIADYRVISCAAFDCDYPELQAWHREDDAEYLRQFRAGQDYFARNAPSGVTVTPHLYPGRPGDAPPAPCRAIESRLHVRHDGEAGFCTDYFGYSLGSTLQSPLLALINGPRAERWRAAVRQHALPLCRHCPWRLQPPSGSAGSAKNR